MKKTKMRARVLLSQEPELNNSDKALMLRFWQDEGLGLSDTQKRIFMDKCTPAESITRVRRALRTEENLKGSEVVESGRYDLYKQYRFNTDWTDTY